jgi:hypothetical protein
MGGWEGARIGVLCAVPRGYMARASHSGSCEHVYGDQCGRQKFKSFNFSIAYEKSSRRLAASANATDLAVNVRIFLIKDRE